MTDQWRRQSPGPWGGGLINNQAQVTQSLGSVLSPYPICRCVSFQGTSFLKLFSLQICMDVNCVTVYSLLTTVAQIISSLILIF